MRRLLIGDKRLRVRDEGESSRTPLVLVHGATCSSVAWLDLVRRVSGRRRVVAIDLPGHGQSDPWHESSIGSYGDAVGTACAALGIPRAVLVGHSMGGAVALHLALTFPEKIAALVLVGTAAEFHPAPAIIRALETDFARFAEFFAQVAYSPATAREIVDRWAAVSVQAPQEVCIADFRALGGWTVRARLGEIRVPTLVLCGEQDLLTPPARSRTLAEGITGARLVLLPRAGHMVFHEDPDGFHAALDPFLAEVP